MNTIDLKGVKAGVLELFALAPNHQERLRLLFDHTNIVNVGFSTWSDQGVRNNLELYIVPGVGIHPHHTKELLDNLEWHLDERPESMLWLANTTPTGFNFITYTKFSNDSMSYEVLPVRKYKTWG